MNATSTVTASEHRPTDAGGFERLPEDVLRMIFRHCLYGPWEDVRHVLIENHPDPNTPVASAGSMHLDLAFSRSSMLPLISRRSSAAATSILNSFIICTSVESLKSYSSRIVDDPTIASRCRWAYLPSLLQGREEGVSSLPELIFRRLSTLRALEMDEIPRTLRNPVIRGIGQLSKLEVLCLKVGQDAKSEVWTDLEGADLGRMLAGSSTTLRHLSLANFTYDGTFATPLARLECIELYRILQHCSLFDQISQAATALKHLVCCNTYGIRDDVAIEDVEELLQKHRTSLRSVDLRGQITGTGSMSYGWEKEALLRDIVKTCPLLTALRMDGVPAMAHLQFEKLFTRRLQVLSLFRVNQDVEHLPAMDLIALCAYLSSPVRPYVLVLEGPLGDEEDLLGPILRIICAQHDIRCVEQYDWHGQVLECPCMD